MVFERREDARSALLKFNGVALDGQAMKIEMAPGDDGGQRTLSSGITCASHPA